MKIGSFRKFYHISEGEHSGTRELLFAFHNLPYRYLLTVEMAPGPLLDEFKEMFKANKKIIFNGAKNKHQCLIVFDRKGKGLKYIVESLKRNVPVIATNIPPYNEVLPLDWLVEAEESKEGYIAVHNAIRNRVKSFMMADFKGLVDDWIKVARELGGYFKKLEKEAKKKKQ